MTDKHEPLKTSDRKVSTEKKENTPEEQNYSLKGTFFFVMLLGVFIILSWATIYALFITR